MSDLLFGRLITAMITPFDSNLDPDYGRAKELVSRLVKGGNDTLVITGTTGEAPTLPRDAKLRLFKDSVEAADGKARIIANVGSNCTSDSIDFARAAEATGVDGLMLVVPYYNKPPQEGLYRHFKAIAESVDLPIVLYNIPGRCSINMTAETTLRLARDVRNIVAVKEASGNFDQISQIAKDAPEGFNVYSGNDGDTLHLMECGGVGVISTIANVCPERMRAIIDAFVAGDAAKAHELNDALAPLMKELFITSNPIMVKEAMKLIGFPCGGVRLPLVDATPEQSAELAGVMKQVGVI